MKVLPLFQHDCPHCVYLGPFEDTAERSQENRYDLYWCEQVGIPTLLARWSDNGPDYLSGANNTELVPLAEAARRAKAIRLTLKPYRVAQQPPLGQERDCE